MHGISEILAYILLIDFVDDLNNREIIYHKKSRLTGIQKKPDITCYPLA